MEEEERKASRRKKRIRAFVFINFYNVLDQQMYNSREHSVCVCPAVLVTRRTRGEGC